MRISLVGYALLSLLGACAAPTRHVPPDGPNDELRREVAAIVNANRQHTVSVAYVDLASNRVLMIDADTQLHAASLMKLPVMIELFRRADEGSFDLDAAIPVVNSFPSMVDGSPFSTAASDDSDAEMYTKVGASMSARELIGHMIRRSSNLATNLLIARAGAAKVEETAHALGATQTRIRRGVEDQKAFDYRLNNMTTARDMATLLVAVARGTAASRSACDEMMTVLSGQEFNDQIPAGLPPGVRVAHKTGQITAILHDAAIVFPNGETGASPFVLCVLTKGFADEHEAQRVTADVARAVWRHHVKL